MKLHNILTFPILAMYILAGCTSSTDQHDHDHDHEIHAEDDHSHHQDHDHEPHDHQHPGSEESDEYSSEGNEIHFPAEKAKAAGVIVKEITPGSFSEVIATSGRILSSASDESTVVATRSGIVRLTRPWSIGMPVSSGAPLFSISASRLPEGDPAAKARVEYAKAKADFDRAESLYKEHLIGAAEYQEAKSNLEKTRISYQALAGDGATGATVTSPRSGYVMECLVKDGQYVDVGTPLMTVTANRRLRLQADLPQREYSRLGSIRTANFQLSQSEKIISIKDLNGTLVGHGRATDGSGAFIPIIFEFDNAPHIPSGVFTEVFLIGAPREGVIAVPKTALVEDQGVYSVFVQEDKDCYTRRYVQIGKSDGNNIEITSGLKGNEKVVVKGATHVKLASASKAIPGHTHNH